MNIKFEKFSVEPDNVVLYVNQANGDIVGTNNVFSTFESAIAKTQTISLNKNVIIQLTSDYIINSSINISGIDRRIQLKTSGHYISSGTSISTYSINNGILSFVVNSKPNGLIINNSQVLLSENVDLHDVPNFLRLSGFEYVDSTTQTFSRNEGVPTTLTTDVIILGYNRWNMHEGHLVSINDSTITVSGWHKNYWDKDSGDGKCHYRILNSIEYLTEGHYCYYSNGDNTYTVLYKIRQNETINSVSIPSLEKYISITNCANITIDGFTFKNSYASKFRNLVQSDVLMPCVVDIQGSHNIVVKNCEFCYNDGYSIGIKYNSSNCRVEKCYLHDLLGGGIIIGYAERFFEDNTTNVSVVDNVIKGIGRYSSTAGAILVTNANSCNVIYNTICDTYYTAIYSGFTWGYDRSYAYNNYIAHNHIHHIMQFVLADGGAIYAPGKQPDTIIEYNNIHDVYDMNLNNGTGIYGENGSSDIIVRFNLIYSCTQSFCNFADNCIVANNIIAYPIVRITTTQNKEGRLNVSYIRNIFKCGSTKQFIGSNLTKSNFSYNLLDFEVADSELCHGNSAYNFTFESDFKVANGTYGNIKVSDSAWGYDVDISTAYLSEQMGTLTMTSYETLDMEFQYDGATRTYEKYYRMLAVELFDVENPYLTA